MLPSKSSVTPERAIRTGGVRPIDVVDSKGKASAQLPAGDRDSGEVVRRPWGTISVWRWFSHSA